MGHGHSHDHGSHGHSHGGDHGHAHGADGACGGGGGPASATLPGGAAALLAAKGLGSAEGATLVIRLVAADGSPLLVHAPRLEVDVKDWSGSRVLPFEAAPEAAGSTSSSIFVAKANRMSPEAGPLTLTAQLTLADGSTATAVWADFFPRKHTA